MLEREPMVLIVDDISSGRKALESLLIGQGYYLEIAENGEQALKKAEAFKPDLILLDVMMPEMDGFEVCRRLRQDPGLAEVPVVMITALDDKESRLKGFAAGADDFVSKPFDRDELRARVRTITRLNRYRSLLAEREKLQNLSRQVMQIQERERRAVAVELHDEIGQGLTGLKHIIRQSREQIAEEQTKSKLDDALAVIGDLIGRVRNLSLRLRPSMLDDFGLFPALVWLADQFSEKTGLVIEHTFSEMDERRFAPEVETAIFRIAQEALTNVSRHADARHVIISINQDLEQLRFQLEDDGCGFDLAEIARQRYISTGLSGMQERAHMAGGVLQIISNHEAGGTKIIAEFVLSEAKKHEADSNFASR
jgi:signal transduction histidine kinase